MIKFIKFKEDVSVEDMERALKAMGVKVISKSNLTGIFKVEVPDKISTKSLKKATIPYTIEQVYDDFPVHTLLDVAIPKVRANLVWERPNKGEGTAIGICDTGVDKEHPDLAGRVLGSKDFTGEGDFDGNGHGTHVSTITIGNGSQSSGKYTGAAPAAQLYMAKGLDRNGSGMASNIVDGIEWLFEQGVNAISLSLGGQAQPGVKDILQETVEAVVDQGIPVFCAAGNSGPSFRTISTPGVSIKAITVGASNDFDKVADFSSRGPTYDGYEKPDVVCPGVGITAGRAKNTNLGNIINDYYTELSGTSMATPLAAGCGLLIIKEHQGISPINLKARLEVYAIDLGTDNDNIEGEGRVDAYSAVTKPQPQPIPEEPSQPPPEEPSCFLKRLFKRSPATMASLQSFRDRVLLNKNSGRWLVRKYYSLSQ